MKENSQVGTNLYMASENGGEGAFYEIMNHDYDHHHFSFSFFVTLTFM